MLAGAIDSRRALVRRGRRPLVGYVSQRNTLAVSERDGRTVVQVDAKTRAMVAVAGILFGPALAGLFALAPERFTRMPWFIQGVVAVTIVAMTFVLLRTLFVRPRIELLPNGDVHAASSTIARRDVRGVTIETDMYSNGRRIFVPNAVLVLNTSDGDVRLCASPDTNLIASLARKAAALTGTDLNQKTTV
jgi:hypothetical protein